MFKVSKEVLEAVLRYLATRPFAEVNQLIGVLQQSEEIKEEKKDEKK